jgi:pimeloyl-ACP methyl ester carboxylesterase
MTPGRRLGVAAALALLFPSALPAAQGAKQPPTVILVHGALLDGSSWNKVIARLLSKKLKVVAVQNPLTSLEDDVAATKRAIAAADGPVVLVGHSWGGVVITEAGDDPKVAALVYVAALAPDVGQSVQDVMARGNPAPAGAEIKSDAAGFLSISAKGMKEDFAQDLPTAETNLLYATQAPIAGKAFGEKVTVAAWRHKPCWYVVAEHDRAADPQLEWAMAKAMGATVMSVPTGHAAMLADPADVATVILKAAEGAK